MKRIISLLHMNQQSKNHPGCAKRQLKCLLVEVSIFILYFENISLKLLYVKVMEANIVFFNLGNNWENCVVELEQTGTPGEVDFGTLSVFGTKKHKVL